MICCCLRKKDAFQYENDIDDQKQKSLTVSNSNSGLNVYRSNQNSLSRSDFKIAKQTLQIEKGQNSTSDASSKISTSCIGRKMAMRRMSTSELAKNVNMGTQILLSKHRSCEIPKLQIDEGLPCVFDNAYSYDVLVRKASMPHEKQESSTNTTSTFEG